MHDKTIDLTVIVNGADTVVKAHPHTPLAVVAERALDQTGSKGRPLEDWELKNAQGQLLEFARTVESYGLKTGTVLYLQPRVGVNGESGVQ